MRRSLFYRWLDKVSLPPLGQRRWRCWKWMGARSGDGYGVLYDPRNGRHGVEYAHVLACEFYHGVPVNFKGARRHTCDVRICVNPYHLIAGTHSANLSDQYARNRRAWVKALKDGLIRNGEATNI